MGVKLQVSFGLVMAYAVVLAAQTPEEARWAKEAARAEIVRDDWGIAHVHGSSDADAVFGMIYAQCEDDFNRVEANYLTSLGRTAEAEGEQAIWQDLRQRLFIDPDELRKDYRLSPDWLRKLMDAWADGINFYLATHKEVQPRVIKQFEPWMALSFTEGSIGGDIERIDLKQLEAFYSHPPAQLRDELGKPVAGPAVVRVQGLEQQDPSGSNGFAVSPRLTRDHHALLLINPHTPFFFRSELQVASDEGLDAYGAVTWGQFFVYQGFNSRVGWMHTSSGVDAVDEYLETVSPRGEGGFEFRYGKEMLPVETHRVVIAFKAAHGTGQRTFTTYSTKHGPVIAGSRGKWKSIRLMNIPIAALEQSYSRTKARDYLEYSRAMELRANSSNNTVYADADGTIAYWQGNFIPKRDLRFDYTQPVDGSDPATDWKGLMTVAEAPHLKDPASGYLFNVNDSPWNGAGASSLKQSDFPAYVEQGLESARGHHASAMMAPGGATRRGWTRDSLLAASFDSDLPWFERTLPALLAAYDGLASSDSKKAGLAEQVALLRGWDRHWSADSTATSLAVFWGTELMRTVAAAARAARVPSEDWVATRVPSRELLEALLAASARLAADFGDWQTPWGEINRFQRITADIVQPFNDAGPSIPVPFTASMWGSLAAFNAHAWPGTKRWYGVYGNSFVAAVEFGDKVRARAVTAGGESGHASDRHFNDEMGMYVSGNFREVYFYPEQLVGHTERTYHPGR